MVSTVLTRSNILLTHCVYVVVRVSHILPLPLSLVMVGAHLGQGSFSMKAILKLQANSLYPLCGEDHRPGWVVGHSLAKWVE